MSIMNPKFELSLFSTTDTKQRDMVFRGAEQSRDLFFQLQDTETNVSINIVMSTVRSPDKNPDIKPV